MPRKGPAPRRDLMPDPIHRSVLVTQLVNKVLLAGKRSVAEKIVYDALEEMERKTGSDPLATLKRALDNVKPALEVKPRRVGGATYQVPVEIRPDRRNSLAMRWIIEAARKRPGKSMSDRLSGEIMDATNNTGAAVRRKEETHKMAEANKAFSHYKW